MDAIGGSSERFDRDAVLAAAGPTLEALQAEARGALRSMKRLIAVAAIIPVVVVAGVFGLGVGALIVPVVLTLIVVFVVVAMRASKRIFAARSQVMEAIAPALGMTFTARPAEPINLAAFEGTYYASLFKYARCDDVLAGERGGVAFEIFDAKVTGRSKGADGEWRAGTPPKWLEGVAFNVTRVVRVEVPGRWTSRTVVVKDAGVANRLYQPKGMERVRLVDARFEQVFEVFSTDQTEARAFLDPVVMERLLELEHLFESTGSGEDEPPPAVAVFADGALLTAMPLAQAHQEGARKLKLADVDGLVVKVLLDEIDAVLGVVDAVARGPAPAVESEAAP